VGHSLKYRSASCCCLIFPHANYVDSTVLCLSTYATLSRNWNLNDSLYLLCMISGVDVGDIQFSQPHMGIEGDAMLGMTVH
jgi:hypothetical protein